MRPPDRPTITANVSTDHALADDHEIDGRYRIEGLIGTGAVGAVYRARHLKVGRPVAIKVLAPEWASHDTMPERFREEARAASSIGHPGIVAVLDAGTLPDGRPYLVMELLEGRSLADVLAVEAPLDPARACTILAGIARAIGAAHQAGIVHRDLKPDNVMLVPSPEGERVKVLDFGIAHAMAPLRGRLTVPGTVLGTPEYMAPEQVRGDPTSSSFDIYALGVIAYEALSGRVPIDGTTSVEIMAKKTRDPPPSLVAARPDLPSALVDLVDACLAREPVDRPADARKVADALDRGPAGTIVVHASEPHIGSPTEPARPRRRLGVGVGVGVGLGLGRGALAAIVWVAASGEAPTRPDVAQGRPDPAQVRPIVGPAPGPPPPASPSGEAVRPTADTRANGPTTDPATLLAAESESGAVASAPGEDGSRTIPGGSQRIESCDDARRHVDAARRGQAWARLLRHIDARGCFSAAERTRLRTKAYMELRRFDRCVAVGGKSRDPEVTRMVELCKARRG